MIYTYSQSVLSVATFPNTFSSFFFTFYLKPRAGFTQTTSRKVKESPLRFTEQASFHYLVKDLQCFLKVSCQIVHIFNADRNANHAWRDAHLSAFCVRYAKV